jgi:hypothetical protein
LENRTFDNPEALILGTFTPDIFGTDTFLSETLFNFEADLTDTVFQLITFLIMILRLLS